MKKSTRPKQAKVRAKKEKPILKLVPNPNPPQKPHPFERFMKINPPANTNSYGNIYRMNTRIPRRRAS